MNEIKGMVLREFSRHYRDTLIKNSLKKNRLDGLFFYFDFDKMPNKNQRDPQTLKTTISKKINNFGGSKKLRFEQNNTDYVIVDAHYFSSMS